ncbi:hypothetical protein MTR67_017648 [Solanum verrucosum]|uniref:F-box associated domain-containing protein n=1 Tax=Solanum verrucosum TaxID=315347 RepID=A0AAF0TS11_SOLVR|nr:hypothetical protein MTR67_017648 [Solanum verrucosum]
MASGHVFIAFQVSESDFVNIHACRSMSRLGGKKFVLHESESVFGIAEQTEDEKYSAPFLQITKFNDIYVQGFSYSPLDYVNGLFCLWGLLSTRPATIFNPSTREPSVCNDGVIYVFNDRAIAAIDVKSEKSETFALWNAPHLSMYYYELIEVKGKLEVIDYKKWLVGRWEKLTSENIFQTSSLGWALASSIFYKYNPVKTYFMSTIKMSLKLNPRGKLQNRLLAQRYCRTQC